MAIQGTGVYIDPFLISTEDDLIEFTTHVGRSLSNYWYVLTNDITMTKPLPRPIGDSYEDGRRYGANFDGRGYTIKNVSLTDTTKGDSVGLFGYAYGGSIRNLTIENISVTSNAVYTGTLFGYNIGTNVENVHIKGGSVKGNSGSMYFGGFAGKIDTNSSYTKTQLLNIIIENVRVEAGAYVAGMVSALYNSNLENVLLINPTIVTTGGAGSPQNAFANEISGVGNSKRLGIYHTTGLSISDYSITHKVLTNPTSISEYTTGDKTGWGGEYWTFGENRKFSMVAGQLPKITFYGRAEKNPVLISTFTELQNIFNGSNEYFIKGFYKLTNDIIVPNYEAGWNEFRDVSLINGTLQSQIDGDGYWLKNLYYNQGSGTSNQSGYMHVSAFNSLFDATLKNIGIEWAYVSFYAWDRADYSFNALAYSYGQFKLENLHLKIGDVYNCDNHYGLSSSSRSIVKNSIIEWNGTYDNSQNITYGYILNDYNMGDSSSFEADGLIIAIKNKQAQPPNNALSTNVKASVANNIRNVVLYSNGYSNTKTWSGGVKQTSSLTDFQNPNYIGYSGFDRSKWIFESGKDPILKAFVKIVEKIEQRLINSYSRISKGVTKRYKGRLNSVKSFSKKYTGKDNRLVKKIRRTLSMALRSVSKVSKKAKARKVMKSFSRTAISRIPTIFKKKIKQVKAFAKNSFSKLTIKKKVIRIKKSWSLKMNSKLLRYRDVIRTSTKSYSGRMNGKLVKYRDVIRISKSFSRKMNARTLSSYLKKILIRVKSFSKPLRSRITAFSNKFTRIKVTVKGYANVIVSNVERKVKRKLIVKSFSNKYRALIQSFMKIASPKNVMAVVTHRFNKINIFKRENKTDVGVRKHKTKINQIDDGGED